MTTLTSRELANAMETMTFGEALKYVAEVAGEWGESPSLEGMTIEETYLAGCIVGIRFMALQIVSTPNDAHLARIVAKLGMKP